MAFGKRNKSEKVSNTDAAPSDNTVKETPVTDTNTAASTEAAASDSRFKNVKLDSQYGDKAGTSVKRSDFIRECWAKKMSRGAIAKELTRLNSVENGGDGKKIPYQVVFAVIKKGTPGGPDKVEAAPAAEQAAA